MPKSRTNSKRNKRLKNFRETTVRSKKSFRQVAKEWEESVREFRRKDDVLINIKTMDQFIAFYERKNNLVKDAKSYFSESNLQLFGDCLDNFEYLGIRRVKLTNYDGSIEERNMLVVMRKKLPATGWGSGPGAKYAVFTVGGKYVPTAKTELVE